MMTEENKMNTNFSRIGNLCFMELKHYCRVCTSNSKTKRPKSDDLYIRIFTRPGLKSILEKFLHLDISENDPLPKLICKKCFEKVMAVETLQVVAKRSENLFKDFLANVSRQGVASIQDNYSGFTIQSPPSNLNSKPEEVVVNVSMSDPLTKDIKKKLQVAQSKRDSVGMAFSPEQLNRNAVTSSPLVQVPVTIVHRMPKKRKVTQSTLDANQIVQIPQAETNTTTVTLENAPQKKLMPLKPKMNPTSPLRHISEAPIIPQNVEIHPVVTGNPHAMGNGMPLGSIIKDVDLLKLILKALKWPYNSQTLDIQIQRLKDTNFNDIIVDPNLLQDTDLIQILGPLLTPLPVTMQQQTYHITIPPETMETPPTTMSYKLPAETSVQIITVPATEKESSLRKQRPTKRHIKSSVMRKKSGNTIASRQKFSPQVIIVSDESEDNQLLQTALANDESPNFGVHLDPSIYPGIGENSNSNEAMLATLNRQREAMMRMHRSKRKQSFNCAKNVEMVDDIMIVDEGFHIDEPYQKNQESHDALQAAPTPQRRTRPSTSIGAKDSRKIDLASTSISAQIKSLPATLSKPSTSIKSVHRSTEYLKQEKSSTHGFVKIKEDTILPPLKKVKVMPRRPSYIQVKEASKVVHLSKNTTLADADSTTKIVIKETKVPKSVKPCNLDSKKTKKSAQIQRSEQGGQNGSSVKNEENAESQKDKDDEKVEVVVVVECEGEGEEKEPVEAITEISKSTKNATANHAETRKNDYKILATFEISDDEMEPLRIEDAPEEPSVEDEQLNTVDESSLKPMAAASVQEESPTEKLKDSQQMANDPPTGKNNKINSFELPAIDIKSEDNEEIEIKNEDIESIDEGQTSKTNQAETPSKANRHFVASKTASKSEIQKSTRSSTKRKVPQKQEAPPKETTTFRPARKSKTLSKYYKGPPLSGTAGRSMRSRT